ncbi:hypothetical protein CK203_096005 [Vitis vinifera]|uniref:Uncharacterized protein n=1 Tax=Vitis vinifera TaxID=29760 RepID=A0A438FCC7_VITVI|nr:hypothetical protein CK203_096005 [Vitis vinifera]
MEEAKTMKTPMSSSIKLDKDEKGKSIDSTMYRGMIGSRSDQDRSNRFVGAGNLKSLPVLLFLHCSPQFLQGKRPAEPSQPTQTKAHRKVRFDTTLFNSVEDYQSSDDFGADFLNSVQVLARCARFRAKEAIQMMCGLANAQEMGGHRDEVSYLEAFLVDSILTERRIHVGYLMMIHMISCYKSSTRVLLYDRFLTKVFKDVGVDLNKETNFEALFESVQFEATFPKPMMFESAYTARPSSQPSFTEPPHTETSPHQAPHVPDHALGWIYLLISTHLALAWKSLQ